jgi:hypothetical protein
MSFENNPYAAPASDTKLAAGRSTHVGDPLGYVDQSSRVRLLTLILCVEGLAALVNSFACSALLLAPEHASDAIALSKIAVLAQNCLFWGGAILFGIVLVQANKNARGFEARDDGSAVHCSAISAFTPASMVWWFCVPLMNLVRPYQAVEAVWAASAPEQGGVATTLRSGVLAQWWGLWLAHTIWSRVANTARPMVSINTANVLYAIDGLLALGACLAALSMIKELERRQSQRAVELVEIGS